MNNRNIQTILLAAALAILANCFQPVDALAMSKPCCCSGQKCTCCCSSRQAPQPSDLLFGLADTEASDCSCSSGPNPYGREANACSIAAELKEKRYIPHNDPLPFKPGASFCNTPAPADKPPPRTVKRLYLLHRAILI